MAYESIRHQDLRQYLRVLWRWKWLILAILIPFPVVAFLYERGRPKTYESSTLIEVQSPTGPGLPLTSGNLPAVARIVTTSPIAERAAQFLNPRPTDPAALVGEVSASADATTDLITIDAQDRNPYRAAAVATAFAKAIGGFQTAQSIASLREQLAPLEQQLKSISRSQSASRASVESQISALRSQIGSSGAGAEILEPATPNLTPLGSSTRRDVEIALVISLLLAIGAVVLAENMDGRVRAPEDLERLTNWPLLAAIPASAFGDQQSEAPGDVEAFQMLRADMTHFNAARRVSSVAIISPLVGDGKTTVAVGLALAAARAGQHTVLIDADLRRPQVSARLGFEASVGLAEVLAGDVSLSDALVDYELGGAEVARLQVLAAGPPPANPTALIRSERMREVLHELEAEADLVVVDTAAALAVSDPLPLLQMVSGVVMVVRMNGSPRSTVRRLQSVVVSSGAVVFGMVASGTTMKAVGYGDYYSSYVDGHHRRRRSVTGRRRRGRSANGSVSGSVANHVTVNGASANRARANGSGSASTKVSAAPTKVELAAAEVEAATAKVEAATANVEAEVASHDGGQRDYEVELEPAAVAGGDGDDDVEDARLMALNMALDGTPREEIDLHLAEKFQRSDRSRLLDEVYGSVER